MREIKLNSLHKDILFVIYEFERGWFDGYDSIQDRITELTGESYSFNQIKASLKDLKEYNLIYTDTMYRESDGMLIGKGWYITNLGIDKAKELLK